VKSEITSARDANALRELSFLSGLDPLQLETLCDCAMKATFAAGEVVFREGDPANRFYVILNGTVALEAQQDNGDPIRIQTLGAGDVLGWSWMFPPYRWHFDARALDPVNTFFFYATRLREHCEADPELGYTLVMRIARVMMDRLQATRRQLSEISTLALRAQWEALHLAAQLGMSPRGAKKHSDTDPSTIRMKPHQQLHTP
jgi:CRP/FNR family cyclic AMP-dependent transcriptional regulator